MSTDGQAERCKKIEQRLKGMDGTPLPYEQPYGERQIYSSTFHQWTECALSASNPDAMRNALYYGFQPLYDVIVEERVTGEQRVMALSALDSILQISKKYILGYYTGQPDIGMVQSHIREMQPMFSQFDGVRYKTKSRNVDINKIYPPNIREFLKKALTYILDNKLPHPDYIVGCACGSSEIALALSGLLETNTGFIRRSYRRGDRGPKIIKEDNPRHEINSHKKNVLCIEDYVCTGESLKTVANAIWKYHPKTVKGSAIRFSREGDYPSADIDESNFKLFTFKKPWRIHD